MITHLLQFGFLSTACQQVRDHLNITLATLPSSPDFTTIETAYENFSSDPKVSVDLNHPAAGDAANAEGEVERNRPGGDRLDGQAVVAHLHDRAFAKLAVDLA